MELASTTSANRTRNDGQGTMQITLPDDPDLETQAIAAGFATIEDYVRVLLDRDAERVAIQQGIDAMRAGKVQSFEEFDSAFRRRHQIPSQS